MKRQRAMKHAGHSGWEAWRAFFDEARDEDRREITRRAHARKVELGLWEAAEAKVGEGGAASAGRGGGGGGGGVRRLARPRRSPGVPEAWRQRQAEVEGLLREREQMMRRRRQEEAAEEERRLQQREEGAPGGWEEAEGYYQGEEDALATPSLDLDEDIMA